MIKTTIWVVVMSGSYAPSGQWATQEKCRQAAISQFSTMVTAYGRQAIPDYWKCVSMDLFQDIRTIEEREIK